MRRLILWSGLLGCLLVALLSLTERGFEVLLALADRALPGRLSVQVEGILLGDWQFHDLHYQTPGVDLRLAHLSLDWRPGALLAGRLEIRQLNAVGVNLTSVEAAGGAETDGLPSLALARRLDLQQAVFDDVQWQINDGPPGSLQKFTLAAHGEGEQLHIEMSVEMSVEMATTHLSTTGTLGLSEGLPLDARLQWRTVVAGISLGGEGELRGRYDQGWQWSQRLTGLLQGDLAGDLRLLPVLGWSLAGQLGVDLASLDPSGSVEALLIDLQSQGTLEDFELQGEVAARVVTLGAVTGQFGLQRQGLEWRLEPLSLQSAESPLALSARGVIDPLTGTVDASGRWQALVWPLGMPVMGSSTGEFQLSGSPQDYRFQLHSDWWHESLGEGRLEASGEGDGDRLALSTLEVIRQTGGAPVLTASASLRHADAYVELQGRWEGLRWPMDVDARPTVTGGQGSLRLSGYLLEQGLATVSTPP